MNRRKTLHLICNAHIDPVWLWEWQEGAAETLSTFRSAADICEEQPDFIFNHNEVILYEWVAEYEPALFERIRKLARQGRWHVMGGWYLQPDCNMPHGESIIRHILSGRRFFEKHFGTRPTTAINLDPFGHNRGLVQILVKAGFDSYLVCRPGDADFAFPANLFRWIGLDGSSVTVLRSPMGYNSLLGQVEKKYQAYMEKHGGDCEVGHFLWGVGNHGGGPSRDDLATLARLRQHSEEWDLVHSTPEAFFAEVHEKKVRLPRVDKTLGPFAVGCYTSQVRIKQKHRQLENELFLTEKMATNAWMQYRMSYPAAELEEAERDLLTSQFHDILPGSSIQPAEETSLRLLDHGLEILSRVKARAFFALAAGQPTGKPDTLPVLVYNPHPFDLDAVVECEMQLPDQNWDETFTDLVAVSGGRDLPTQVEKELSNIPIDWRKRVVFQARLKGNQMNRFECRMVPGLPPRTLEIRPKAGRFAVQTDDLDLIINAQTGLLDRFRVKGIDYLRRGAFEPVVMRDSPDPWGMLVHSFPDEEGRFRLATPEESAEVSGVTTGSLEPVRVVESGPVRTVIEAVFCWNRSFLILTYRIPQRGAEVEVEVRVFWNEKNRLLKLSIPTVDRRSRYVGQVVYGREDLASNGTECVAQRWTAAVTDTPGGAVTLINDGTYGSDFQKGEIRPTLLRSPAYSAHPIGDRPVVPQTRFTPRIDQGERVFTFWLNAGPSEERMAMVEREAQAKNERPVALAFFPSGSGERPLPGPQLSDQSIVLTAMKQSSDGKALIVRLFEPEGKKRRTRLEIPACAVREIVSLTPFEIKTLRISLPDGICREANLLEEVQPGAPECGTGRGSGERVRKA